MAASGSGYLPDTYTPGEVIPPVVPVIPDTPPVISGNAGAGTVAYNDTYQAAISDYSVLRSMSLSDANSVIYQNYRSVTSQLEEIQAEINSGEANLADNQDQITKLEAQRAAASDTYKQMNDGQDISTYTPEV